MGARWARIELLQGVLAVVAWLVGIVMIEGFGDSPSDDATAEQLLAYFQNEENSLYIGSIFFFIGSALLIWFGATLRSALVTASRDWFGTAAFGAAVALASLSMGLLAPQIGGAFAANETEAPLTPEAAQALWFAGDGFFVASEFAAAALLAAVGLAALTSRVFPTWFGWLSLLIALVLLIPPIGWAGLIFGVPIWILLVTVFLWRGSERAEARAETVPPA